MTDDEIRIEIAKLDRWELTTVNIMQGWKPVIKGKHPDYDKGQVERYVPEYCESLDAMRLVLSRSLDEEHWLEFMLQLCFEVQMHSDLSKWTICRALLESTARQQAVALLKALGKWTD